MPQFHPKSHPFRSRRSPFRTGLVSFVQLILALCAAGVHAQNEPADPQPAEQAPAAPAITITAARDLLNDGQYERAFEAFEQLASQTEHASAARLGIAQCRMMTGGYREGIDELRANPQPDNSQWQFVLAELLGRVGEYESALAALREAVGLDPDHLEARFGLGQMLETLGRREQAIEAYRWFHDRIVGAGELTADAGWLTWCGQGFLRYSVLTGRDVARHTQHVLNEMYVPAYSRIDRGYWPARIAAAELLREKYNNDEEDGSVSDYRAALRINPNLPEALVGLGEVLLEVWQFEQAQQHAERALKINPNFSPALHLLAQIRIQERRYDDAVAQADGALRINPNDLTALSLKAAALACAFEDQRQVEVQTQVASINPRCALLYRTLGVALSGVRQYEACEKHLLKAIELEPSDANARTELGMMYMQWGREQHARQTLERAWSLDPYNVRTKHTLELLESLERFDRHETEHFVICYDAKQDPGVGTFLGDYLESIYAAVTGDYGVEPEVKTTIEVFPTHRAFGVRITGRPWIHTVGACTGSVIAMDSPRESTQTMGPYNVARVLKHEFTHTVTLAATNNRIPHWLTEGLAVLQEDSPRSYDWCWILAEAVRRDELFSLDDINWGFMRPRRPNARMQAYAQSEWMCEFIIDRWGYDSINALLKRFRDGKTQVQAFEEQLKISEAEFDSAFRQWAGQQASKWCFDLTPPVPVAAAREEAELKPQEAAVLARLARAELDAGFSEPALEAARRALAIDDEERTALKVLVSVLAEFASMEASEAGRVGYADQALPALLRFCELEPGDWLAPKLLADIYLRRRNFDAALPQLIRLQQLCSLDPASYRGLAGIYLKRGQDDLALPQLLELARSEEHDPQVAQQIGQIYRRQQKLPDAIYWFRQSLYINLFDADAHRELAETQMMAGDTKGALSSYTMLTLLEPRKARNFSDAAVAAHKLGEEEQARRFAQQAIALDPDSPARALLPE